MCTSRARFRSRPIALARSLVSDSVISLRHPKHSILGTALILRPTSPKFHSVSNVSGSVACLSVDPLKQSRRRVADEIMHFQPIVLGNLYWFCLDTSVIRANTRRRTFSTDGKIVCRECRLRVETASSCNLAQIYSRNAIRRAGVAVLPAGEPPPSFATEIGVLICLGLHRQRHLKCDEAKPVCQRCVNDQKPCQGYHHIRTMTFEVLHDTKERRSYHYFNDQVAPQLFGHHNRVGAQVLRFP